MGSREIPALGTASTVVGTNGRGLVRDRHLDVVSSVVHEALIANAVWEERGRRPPARTSPSVAPPPLISRS